jgi:Zn-dependent peptidase ImmA (M78 family)
MAVRRRKIGLLVKEVLAQAGVQSPPVNVEQIVSLRGLDLRRNDAQGSDISGFLFLGSARPIIGVNGSQASTRQRFTIAHELGHYLLHGVTPQEVHVDRGFKVMMRDGRSSEGVDEAEREANLFAAELLMPEELLRRDLQNRPEIDINDDEVDKWLTSLASRYEVSKQAMMFRLANLGHLEL